MNQLSEKISRINELLDSKGARAVQKKPGLGNRPELFGYIPQFVFDAVSEVLGADSWSHTVDEHFYTEKQAVVRVTVTIGGASHTQFGESQIIRGDTGSALKGAVTDAVQKCLALFGIGSKAYRGELKPVFQAGTSMSLVDAESPSEFDQLCREARALNKGSGKPDLEQGRVFWKKCMATGRLKGLSETEKTQLAKILRGA